MKNVRILFLNALPYKKYKKIKVFCSIKLLYKIIIETIFCTNILI